MEWDTIIEFILPSLVGAGSAILSSVLTNQNAERREKRSIQSRERELDQRLMEVLIPQRIQSYKKVFTLLQKLKERECDFSETVDLIIPQLLWMDQEFSAKVISSVEEIVNDGLQETERIIRLSTLQDEIRKLVGAKTLNQEYKRLIDNR